MISKNRKREALVYRHLEGVSRSLFVEHGDLVRNLIGSNQGIYALYKRDRLQYVGLASSLANRLKVHLRDRHKNSWDHFSIYFTIKDSHIKELESLLLRIARPSGNTVSGKPKDSLNLLPSLRSAIKLKQKGQLSTLLGTRKPESRAKAIKSNGSELLRLFPNGASLRSVYGKQTFRARLQKNGRVRVGKELFATIGLAASHVAGRRKNGWLFWYVERGKGNWVKLAEIRRAGTPFIGR